MTALDELREITIFGEARFRDCDAFLAEWILEGDDEDTQQRLYLAYLKGMIDTHVRATNGEEPGLTVTNKEEPTDGTQAEYLYRNQHRP